MDSGSVRQGWVGGVWLSCGDSYPIYPTYNPKRKHALEAHVLVRSAMGFSESLVDSLREPRQGNYIFLKLKRIQSKERLEWPTNRWRGENKCFAPLVIREMQIKTKAIRFLQFSQRLKLKSDNKRFQKCMEVEMPNLSWWNFSIVKTF